MGSKLETLHRQIVPGQGMLCILPDQTIFEGTATHVFSFSIVQQIFFGQCMSYICLDLN